MLGIASRPRSTFKLRRRVIDLFRHGTAPCRLTDREPSLRTLPFYPPSLTLQTPFGRPSQTMLFLFFCLFFSSSMLCDTFLVLRRSPTAQNLWTAPTSASTGNISWWIFRISFRTEDRDQCSFLQLAERPGHTAVVGNALVLQGLTPLTVNPYEILSCSRKGIVVTE